MAIGNLTPEIPVQVQNVAFGPSRPFGMKLQMRAVTGLERCVWVEVSLFVLGLGFWLGCFYRAQKRNYVHWKVQACSFTKAGRWNFDTLVEPERSGHFITEELQGSKPCVCVIYVYTCM